MGTQDIGMDILGADIGGGFDIKSFFSAAGEVVDRGVTYHQQKQAAESAAKDADAKLKAAIAADAACLQDARSQRFALRRQACRRRLRW